jgi:hypothetical protein
MKAYCAGSVSQLKQALVESGHWNTYAENCEHLLLGIYMGTGQLPSLHHRRCESATRFRRALCRLLSDFGLLRVSLLQSAMMPAA